MWEPNTVDPHYLQIPYAQICLLTKICSPKSTLLALPWSYVWVFVNIYNSCAERQKICGSKHVNSRLSSNKETRESVTLHSALPGQPAQVFWGYDGGGLVPPFSRPVGSLDLGTTLCCYTSVNTLIFKQHVETFCKNYYCSLILPPKRLFCSHQDV